MAVSMCRNPSIEKVRPICGIAFCRTKWHRRSEMPFYVARNGFDDRKCRFMSHEMALTIGNAVLCRTKWLRRSEMPFYVARNGIDGRKCRFMSHEMASTVGNAVLCRTKNDFDNRLRHFHPRKTPFPRRLPFSIRGSTLSSRRTPPYPPRMLFNLRTVLYLCLRIRKDEGGARKNLLIFDNKGLTRVERIR